jgi:hypothetical protein
VHFRPPTGGQTAVAGDTDGRESSRRPHRRYFADLLQADAIVADGWAARHLPAMLDRQVAHVPKGVDTDVFTPDGVNKRADLGSGQARGARHQPPGADQERGAGGGRAGVARRPISRSRPADRR